MSRRRKNRLAIKNRPAVQQVSQPVVELSPEQIASRNKRYDILVLLVLLVIGVYFSILYYGYQPVPNPDFTAFASVGHKLLSFQPPNDFKRAPVYGIIIAAVGHVVGGQHPDLTAGWTINAVLFPCCMVLIWQIGKRVVGQAAVWIAIAAMINPYAIQLLSDPIAEITLLFFTLLTFYLIFKGTRWCYLFASITMMVRYEGAALILAAFFMDMIRYKDVRNKIISLVCAGFASVPLIVWMMFTYLASEKMGGTYYLNEMGVEGGFAKSFVEFLKTIWLVSVYPLFAIRLDASKEATTAFNIAIQVILAATFLFGSVWAIMKKKWEVTALLIFFVPYFFIHVLHSFMYGRFVIIVHWIVLIIAVLGFQGLLSFVKLPKIISGLAKVALAVLFLVWMFSIVGYVLKNTGISPRSISVPYVLAAGAVVLAIGSIIIYSTKRLLHNITVAALMMLVFISNQLVLVSVMGKGTSRVEFKMLADWYVDNVGNGDKMLCSLPNVLRIYAPEYKNSFVHLNTIKANDPAEFVNTCYRRGIKYVTWDYVGGANVGSRYYELWGFANIEMLSQARSFGPYEFVDQIAANEEQYINVYRLKEKGQ